MSSEENEVCKGMEATQLINDSILESDEDENEEETNKRGQPLAKLRILKNQHMSETELPLFLGDNVLGRDPSSCTLTLPAASVSKQHATICISVYRRRSGQSEVDTEALVWDLGSMNGTRKGQRKLTPNVRYALSEGDSLVVADIPCQYVSWSAHTASSQGDTRTPTSQSSGVKARFPDASRENEGDTSTGSKKCVDSCTKPLASSKSPDGGRCLSFEQTPIQSQGTLVPESDSDSDGDRGGNAGRSRHCLVTDSDSQKSSPNCSTFLSPVNKTIPESEDESLVTPSSLHKNRPHRHVSFTTEETDEDAGRQELHQANAVKNMNVCEAEGGRQEKRASEGLLAPGKEDSNVSPSGEVGSPVSNPVIPAFNMDSDTDVEGEEEGVMSAGVEAAVPMILNTSHQADRPPDTVQFHMDSDTDNGEDENEDVLSKAPEMLPSVENPQVISVSVATMDSDTDVDEDAAVSDAATKVKAASFQSTCSADSASSAQLKKFHLDSDTDAEEEEEEEERGAKPSNSKKHETSNKLDIKLIGPNSTSAAPNSLHLNSDTDNEAVAAASANKPSATVTELIAATDIGADLDILSDSDTDAEDNVPLATPPAVQTLAGTTSEATQPDSDADTDVDEASMPPAGDLADQVERVDSDTDVDDVSAVVAGVDQIAGRRGDVPPGILVPLPQLNCSTPLHLPDEVAEMDTQAFISPMPAPSVRPAVLPSFQEHLEDEDFAEAETQAFIPITLECKDSSQTFVLDSSVDKNNQSSRGDSLRLGLSDSDHLQDQTADLQSSHVEETQAKASVSVENASKGQQAYETAEERAKCSLMPDTEDQRNLDLEDTQPYISELCSSDLEDDADGGEDQNDAPTETEPLGFDIPSAISMAETQLMSTGGEEIMTTTSHIFPVQQTKLVVIHDIGATQPMATCEGDSSDGEDSLTVPRKRKAKKLHLEDEETQELTNSEVFVAETQRLAPSEDDDDDDTDSIVEPRKRKAKPLQIENETQSLPGSEVFVAETQRLAPSEDDDDDDTDSIVGPRKRKAKPLQMENETQSLPGSEVSAFETQPLDACEGEQCGEEDLSPGPRKRKAKPLQFEDELTQPLTNSDASTLETRPLLTPNDKGSENNALFSAKRKEKRLHLTDEETQPLNNSDISTVETQPSNTETCPQTEEHHVKGSENGEASTEVQRRTRASTREVQQKAESSVHPKRLTRGQRKSLPSTKAKKGNSSADEDEEEVDRTNGARWKNITRPQKNEDRGLEMEPTVDKSIKKEGEDSGNKSKAEVQQETLPAENAERTRKEETKEEQKPRTPARGPRGRRTVAAQSTMNLVSTPDDVPARRTRSRSNSSNSVSSERSASSVTNRENKGRGRGAKRTSEIPQTTVRSTRKSVAAGAAELDRRDVDPRGLIFTPIMSNSLNAEPLGASVSSQNKGRGGKRREKETKTEPCSESGAPVSSQSPQLSAPTTRGRKSRKTERSDSEVIRGDDQSKTDSQQSSATRGRRQASANGSQPSEKGHTEQEKESLLPKRNIRGRGQKIENSETMEESLVPTASDGNDVKYNNGKRQQGECGSNHTEKIPKTDAAKEERKDIIQEKTSSAASGTQAKPDAKTSLDVKVEEKETCETETIQRKVRGRPSVAAKKKKEESRESEASASSMEADASELPETPSNRASRKRQATADSPLAAKSLRSSAASPVAGGRRRATSQTYRVLFTGMEDEAGKRVLARLGGVMANGVADMNCLVTDKVRRTVKFLCAVAKGVPVVTTEWLEKSGKSGSFLSTSTFLVKDADQEKKFNFSLAESLSAASSRPLLQGYEIHVTKSVLPEPVHMREIIACSGAMFLPKMPSSHKPHTVVISCEEDWRLCGPAVSASLPVVTAEFILTGILQQRIDCQTHVLSPPAPNLQAAGGRRSKKKV